MRTVTTALLLTVLAIGLMGCAQSRSAWNAGKRQVASLSSRVQGCCPPAQSTACAPAPQACQPQQPICCWQEPVYNSCCGGDNGIGRGGTGAFKIP